MGGVHCAFTAGRIIRLDKFLGVIPVRVRETWVRLMANCILEVAGPKAKEACSVEQFYMGLKGGIKGGIFSMQMM